MNLAGIGTQEELELVIKEYCEGKRDDSTNESILNVITWQMKRQQGLIFFYRSISTDWVEEELAYQPQTDEEGELWVKQLCAAYNVRPACVIDVINDAQFSPMQVKHLMRGLPEILPPFPENSRIVLSTLTYEESVRAVEKAPDLFHQPPQRTQRRIINDFHKDPSRVKNAVISMFEYPPLWEFLIQCLSTKELHWLINHSSLMKILRKEIKDITLWKSFIHFVIKDDSAKKEAIERAYCQGRDYWKLLVNPNDVHHGPMVYDKGYHGGDVEQGYMLSMKAGLLWVLYCSTQDLSPENEFMMYKKLHQIVLSHTKSHSKHLFRGEFEKKLRVTVPAQRIVEAPDRVCRSFTAETIGVTSHPRLNKVLKMFRSNPNNMPRYVHLHFSYKTAPTETQLTSIFAMTQQELRRCHKPEQRLLQIARKHQIL